MARAKNPKNVKNAAKKAKSPKAVKAAKSPKAKKSQSPPPSPAKSPKPKMTVADQELQDRREEMGAFIKFCDSVLEIKTNVNVEQVDCTAAMITAENFADLARYLKVTPPAKVVDLSKFANCGYAQVNRKPAPLKPFVEKALAAAKLLAADPKFGLGGIAECHSGGVWAELPFTVLSAEVDDEWPAEVMIEESGSESESDAPKKKSPKKRSPKKKPTVEEVEMEMAEAAVDEAVVDEAPAVVASVEVAA